MFVFKTQKTIKTVPKAPTNDKKTTLEFITNNFGEQSIFGILSLRKPRLLSPQHRNFGLEID